MKLKKFAAAVSAAAVFAAASATVTWFGLFSVTANADYTLTKDDYRYTVNYNEKTAAIIEYNGTDEEVEIPKTLDGNAVITIGEHAFSSCKSVTSVTIPDSVTTIGKYVFIGCTSLASVTIHESVKENGDWGFGECGS
ncbi:MAG: leucine-rich repeat domain-containing protein, partial [Oscillospiraceae bacterium]|nr:leucine-rich repeat domain-containing protein [Oscillospiraceae bacterium]